jgi:hypothetical protein
MSNRLIDANPNVQVELQGTAQSATLPLKSWNRKQCPDHRHMTTQLSPRSSLRHETRPRLAHGPTRSKLPEKRLQGAGRLPKALRSTPERKVKVAEPSAKKQFAVIAKNGEIQAIVLVRDAGFYCFEQSQQPPKNMSELMKLYQECELIELELKQKWESAP